MRKGEVEDKAAAAVVVIIIIIEIAVTRKERVRGNSALKKVKRPKGSVAKLSRRYT